MEVTNGGLVTALALRGGSGRNLNPKRPRPTEVLTLSGGHAQPPRMIEYFRNRRLTDVTIRACDGRTFEAHRNILAASSDYLHGRMGADWSDSAGPIEFPHLSASALEKLLEYVYVGEVSLSESLIIPLLECAHYLQVLSLLHAAAVAIQLRLEASNSLETWTLADRYSITTLEKAAMKVVLKEFAQCRAGSTFLRMPLRFMRDLLEADMLLAPEEDVFESTVDWLRAQPAAALAEAAATLLNLVRYPQLPRQYVSERVMMDPLLQQLPGGAAAILLPSMMDKSYGTPSRTWNARGVPRGVQRDLPRSFLDGWTQHVCVSYVADAEHGAPLPEKIESIPLDAEYVFVGAQRPDGSIAIGAVGPREAVCKRTLGNRTHEANGVHWYFCVEHGDDEEEGDEPGGSFGFSRVEKVSLSSADTLGSGLQNGDDEDRVDENGHYRLSWHYGEGWRAGLVIELDSNKIDRAEHWMKLLYYR